VPTTAKTIHEMTQISLKNFRVAAAQKWFCPVRLYRTTENSPAIHRWDGKIGDEVREADD
jgi:hypothetical protein